MTGIGERGGNRRIDRIAINSGEHPNVGSVISRKKSARYQPAVALDRQG